MLNVAGKGGRILTTAKLYGGTVDSFSSVFPDLGLEIDLVENPDEPAEFRKKLTAETKAVFIEA